MSALPQAPRQRAHPSVRAGAGPGSEESSEFTVSANHPSTSAPIIDVVVNKSLRLVAPAQEQACRRLGERSNLRKFRQVLWAVLGPL